MNPARIIYEDTPAYIPIPEELRHRKVEVIFWPLETVLPEVANSQAPKPRWSELFQRFTRNSDIDPSFKRDELYDDRLR
jgi:hypothetical protein